MQPETIEALDLSIEHWRQSTTAEFKDVGIYSNDCALCHRFGAGDDSVKDCVLDGELCPIRARTGENLCEGTPWWSAHRTYNRWSDTRTEGTDDKKAKEDFRCRAQAMLDFLISLKEDAQ